MSSILCLCLVSWLFDGPLPLGMPLDFEYNIGAYEFGQMVSDLIHYYCKKEPNPSSLNEMIADSLRVYYYIWNTNLLSTYLWLDEYFSCPQVMYGRQPIIQWKCEEKNAKCWSRSQAKLQAGRLKESIFLWLHAYFIWCIKKFMIFILWHFFFECIRQHDCKDSRSLLSVLGSIIGYEG